MIITLEEAILMSAELAAEQFVCVDSVERFKTIESCRILLREEVEERVQSQHALIAAWSVLLAKEKKIAEFKQFQWDTKQQAEKELQNDKRELLCYVNHLIQFHIKFESRIVRDKLRAAGEMLERARRHGQDGNQKPAA
jgi:hypothetical protein